MSSQKLLICIWLSKSIFFVKNHQNLSKKSICLITSFFGLLYCRKRCLLFEAKHNNFLRICLFFATKIYLILHLWIGNLLTRITIFSDLLNASSKISFCMVLPLTSGKLRANSSKLGTPDLITNVKSEMGISPELQKKKPIWIK